MSEQREIVFSDVGQPIIKEETLVKSQAHPDSPSSSQQEGQIAEPQINQHRKVIISHMQEDQDLEEGEIGEQQIYSSQDDESLKEEEKKKWDNYWKNMEANQECHVKIQQDKLYQLALDAVQKTNKRIMILRKKNYKKIEELDKNRMTHQPDLSSMNPRFRGFSSDYPTLTQDLTGRQYFQPNDSLRVNEMRLDHFILKNIKEENTANYLSEVVKFENYAYQQRKKRKQNIQ